MTANNKKILTYGGIAIGLGAVAFFVYSFFKKQEITIGNTSIALSDKNDSNDVDYSPETVPSLNLKTFDVADKASIDELVKKYM